jgi:flavodoxin long chain
MTDHHTPFSIDASNPRVMIVHEGEEDLKPADYRAILHEWVARLDAQEQTAHPTHFGVLLVHGHHTHEEGEEHERDTDSEAEIVKLFNDFRRAERARISTLCTGFANVYEPAAVVHWYQELEGGLARLQEYWERFSQYNFGIPSLVFTEVEGAVEWLNTLVPSTLPPAEEEIPAAPPTLSNRVGLFYGSTTGFTEYVAESLADLWQGAGQSPLSAINITDLRGVEQFLAYNKLILGIPTWNIGQLQDDWEIVLPQLARLDFTETQIALFGVGDARGYPDNFLDAMGMLGQTLRERGAQLVGYWSTEGYDFDEFLAVDNGQFMGLGIDETSQPEQTVARLQAWIEQIIREFALEPVAPQEIPVP